MRALSLNTGPDFHLLDHIAPIANHYQMPLAVTEELNLTLAQKFYPQVPLQFRPNLEFELAQLANDYDALYECKFWQPHLKTTFKSLYNKEMELIFCQHGQSDKGYNAPLLSPYTLYDRVLIYGQLMLTMLDQLNILEKIKNYTLTGNLRHHFYLKHKPFYDNLAEKEIFSHLNKKNKTVLYAPTWNDADQASSFFQFGKQVITELPLDWNLVLKLHPLLEQRDPAQFYQIAHLMDKKPNAILVDAFPPVYPILERVDCYLGDFSSIGYDFLAYEKPMYFFPSQLTGRLRKVGIVIDCQKHIYPQLEVQNKYTLQQRQLYVETFSHQ